MEQQSLLERISQPLEGNSRSTGLDYRLLANSILNHLQRMLNTRRGSVPITKEYGVPDFGSLFYDLPDSLNEFQQAIRTTIERYEPRLQQVRVKLRQGEETALQLSFEITAVMVTGQRQGTVLQFHTLTDSDGKIEVRE